MADGALLLEAIQREPEEDVLRLIYADWLDDNGDPERAEFIRVQIEGTHLLGGSPEHEHLTDRAVHLLSKHGALWASGYETVIPPDADLSVHKGTYPTEDGIVLMRNGEEHQGEGPNMCSRVWVRRGFVEEIDLIPERFFSLALSDIRPTGPLATLRLEAHNRYDSSFGALEDYVGRLASAPLLYRFQDVCIDGGFSRTSNEGLRLLANERALLAQLSGLNLSEARIGDRGVLPLLESPHLTRLRELAIDETECTDAVLRVLLHSNLCRGMTSLHLGGVIEGARGLRVFGTPGRWPRLQCLSLSGCGLGDLTLRGLMRPGAFPALECLDLAFCDVHRPALRALLLSGAFPRLRLLGVGGTPLTLDEVRALRAEFGHRVEINPSAPPTD